MLYVGLTRAAERLIITGVAPSRGEVVEDSWHTRTATRARRARRRSRTIGPWGEGLSWRGSAPPRARAPARRAPAARPRHAPRLGAAPGARGGTPAAPAQPVGDRPRPRGAAAAIARAARRRRARDPAPQPVRAAARGRPRRAPPRRARLARRAPGSPTRRARARSSMPRCAMIDDPRFADLFAPDALAEAPIAATLARRPGHRRHGRPAAASAPTVVRVIDFKTGRSVPASAAALPPGARRADAGLCRARSASSSPAAGSRRRLLYTARPDADRAAAVEPRRVPVPICDLQPNLEELPMGHNTKTVTDQSFEADVLDADKPGAGRFLGRMVRAVQDDRPGARGNRRRARRQGRRSSSSTSTRIPTRRANMACAASRRCCCSRTASRSRKRSAPRRAARSSSGSKASWLEAFRALGTRRRLGPSSPRVSGRKRSWRGRSSPGSNQPTLLAQKIWKPGAIAPGSSSVAMLKSTVSGWWSTRIASGVPQLPQNRRWPKSLDLTRRGSPLLDPTSRPTATLAKAIAGAPLLSWQVRQWHQPASNGALASRSAPRRTGIRRSIPCVSLSAAGGSGQLTKAGANPTSRLRHRPRVGRAHSHAFARPVLEENTHARRTGQKHLRFGQRPLRPLDGQDRRRDRRLRADHFGDDRRRAARPDRHVPRSGSPTATSSTTSSPKPSPRCARRPSARSASAITTSR